MKYNDPFERIKKVKVEILDLKEMIRNTDNTHVMQACLLQINEYEEWLKECRMQNEFTASRNGLLKLKR